MSFWDRAKAAAREATKAAQDLVKEADQTLSTEDWYKATKEASKEVAGGAKHIYSVGRDVAVELANEASQTDAGRTVGAFTRDGLGFLSKLPVLSAVGDAFRAANGIDALTNHLRENPQDAERHLLLAEALKRLETDQRRYRAIRTAVDPSYLIVDGALRSTASLGTDLESDDVPTRLLKNAFALSLQTLKKTPRDARALHVLARVYLVTGHSGEAVRFAKLAILAAPHEGMPMYTLGRAYLALNQRENAERAAYLAVERGASCAYDLLGELAITSESGTSATRVDAYVHHRSLSTPECRAQYWGPAATGVDLVSAVGAAQFAKSQALFDSLRQQLVSER
jgi:tetratricopeptide (TPR) repeat protein